MSSVHVSRESATGSPPAEAGEVRLEVVVVPVSDVDRAKRFYETLGWRLDAWSPSGASSARPTLQRSPCM